jgi:hypothetical protein
MKTKKAKQVWSIKYFFDMAVCVRFNRIQQKKPTAQCQEQSKMNN